MQPLTITFLILLLPPISLTIPLFLPILTLIIITINTISYIYLKIKASKS